MDGSKEFRSNPHPDPGVGGRRHRSSKRDPLLPDDLVWEILTRLPVKSLMRFRCVSRLWRSIILDPTFAKAYRGGFRGLLIFGMLNVRLSEQMDFYYVNIHDIKDSKVEISNHLRVDHGGKLMASTEVVKGLVCFFVGNHSYCYNIATRETMELPVSGYESENSRYFLGFDPANKVYKLLKTCPVYLDDYYLYGSIADDLDQELPSPEYHLNSEILTIGVDSSWRIIDPVPASWDITCRSMCHNGVLHWMQFDRSHRHHLIGFSLGEEKFRSIFKPKWGLGSVLRFGPRLTVYLSGGSPKESYWEIYECGGEGSGVWTESKIIRPYSIDLDDHTPKGTLPDGRLLISNCHDDFSFPKTYYTYNPTNKQFEKILIPEYPLREEDDVAYLTYHEENIIPLNCLNSLI